MATGGIFQLITNDGKQDRMLMATQLLDQRLQDARAKRCSEGKDPTPTLYDIERTHILFTNAHFKPFAAIGYEYNKVTAQSGTLQLGNTITFSIPQFGDFFNDMIVHATITQPTLAASTLSAGNQNLMRWCAYPGERLLESVKFEVNGNPLDEYTSYATNFYREFGVQPNKEVGWARCVGQEEPEEGYLEQPTWENNAVARSSVKHRMCVQTKSGNQTPTGQKTEDLELFIPLLFWMNKDPRLSIPSVAIPYGQRFITLKLCEQWKLVGEVPRGTQKWTAADIEAGGQLGTATCKLELYINNIFVNPEVHNIFIQRIGFTLIRVHRRQTATTEGSAGQEVLLQQLKWPIEALYVGVRMSAYNSPDQVVAKEHLDKWHKFCHISTVDRDTQGWRSRKTSTTTGATVQSVITDATGTLTIAATAATDQSTLTAGTAGQLSDLKVGDVLAFTNANGNFTGTVAVNTGTVVTFEELGQTAFNNNTIHVGGTAATTSVSLTTYVSAEAKSKVAVCRPTMTEVTIKAHGIPIYNKFPAKFYNAYIPYNYGGPNIRTPSDPGALLITFCLYPGTYQPSGHINVSRAREFYIEFSTNPDFVKTTDPGTLIVVASAINFLLISDGSAVLRYST